MTWTFFKMTFFKMAAHAIIKKNLKKYLSRVAKSIEKPRFRENGHETPKYDLLHGNYERSGGRGGWVVRVVLPPDGWSESSMLACGVEQLKSSVARICEPSMDEGRACPSWLASTTATSFPRRPAWGLAVPPNSIWVSEPPTRGEADPACSNSHVTITTPFLLVIFHSAVRIDIAYSCTKFNDFRFSRSSDMIEAHKIL